MKEASPGGRALVKRLRGKATVAMSTDEILGLTRGVGSFLVDGNVLLDVLTDDPSRGVWSGGRLAECADRGSLVINPIVYAEASVGFQRVEELEEALPPSLFRRDPLPDFYIAEPTPPWPASRRCPATPRDTVRTVPVSP